QLGDDPGDDDAAAHLVAERGDACGRRLRGPQLLEGVPGLAVQVAAQVDELVVVAFGVVEQLGHAGIRARSQTFPAGRVALAMRCAARSFGCLDRVRSISLEVRIYARTCNHGKALAA